MHQKDFWDNAFLNKDNFFVSDTKLLGVARDLELWELFGPEKRLLNIGIGRGSCVRGFSNAGCIVDTLDISEHSLECVKDVVRKHYLVSNIEELPENHYNLIVSHLVVQHMNYSDMCEQLPYIIRSLKENGVFAMQFLEWGEEAIYPNDSYIDERMEVVPNKGRTIGFMADIINEAGGKVLMSKHKKRSFDTEHNRSGDADYPEGNLDCHWNIIHVGRGE